MWVIGGLMKRKRVRVIKGGMNGGKVVVGEDVVRLREETGMGRMGE